MNKKLKVEIHFLWKFLLSNCKKNVVNALYSKDNWTYEEVEFLEKYFNSHGFVTHFTYTTSSEYYVITFLNLDYKNG